VAGNAASQLGAMCQGPRRCGSSAFPSGALPVTERFRIAHVVKETARRWNLAKRTANHRYQINHNRAVVIEIDQHASLCEWLVSMSACGVPMEFRSNRWSVTRGVVPAVVTQPASNAARRQKSTSMPIERTVSLWLGASSTGPAVSASYVSARQRHIAGRSRAQCFRLAALSCTAYRTRISRPRHACTWGTQRASRLRPESGNSGEGARCQLEASMAAILRLSRCARSSSTRAGRLMSRGGPLPGADFRTLGSARRAE
jgi:hypothetical protein